MKKSYESPVVTENMELAEGVYMASGEDCYSATARIHQKPETGRGDYRIQVNGKHKAEHTKEKQILHIHFNMPVSYISSGGNLIKGDGTSILHIQYFYHQNPNDNIGLGDLIVQANTGLSVTKVYITD